MRRLEDSLHSALRAHGDLPAVTHRGQTLSYSELHARAEAVARQLAQLGVGPDSRVGISLERSLDLAVAVLAAWKSGAAYVPLDPNYPEDRLALMIEDAGLEAILTNVRWLASSPLDGILPPSLPRVDVPSIAPVGKEESLGPARSGSEHLAYVIFTSGSTGRPKGVALGRGALENLIEWQLIDSKAGAGTRTLQFTPISFDVHFQEFFSTWASGGELMLIDEEERLDSSRLLAKLEADRIERLFLPFVALQGLADAFESAPATPALLLGEVITAGEQLRVTPQLRALFASLPHSRLFNHYGPSETHVVTSLTLDARDVAKWPELPSIGHALPNVLTRIESASPETEPGELYLGGVALAHGYLGRPELTAERFTESDGQRWYRTGDLVKRAPNGEIEYLGRIDDQVKIRGFRVELGEVEACIALAPGVAQVAVAAREDRPGERKLVAYVVFRAGDSAAAPLGWAGALREHVAKKLPDYMQPSAWVSLAELPRTPSGKVDRRALPRPGQERPELAQPFVAPRMGTESILATLWAELLEINRVGAADGFFELGGNSLLGLRMTALLRKQHGMIVPIVKLFQYPTVEALARWLEAGSSGASAAKASRSQGSAHAPIAIIGMAGRFPGARTVDELWRVLIENRETTSFFEADALDPSIPATKHGDPAYVAARGMLADADRFDAAFFGVSAREAELLDPQQRLFLETAWEALEDSGYSPTQPGGPVGVFAGTHNNSYAAEVVAKRPDLVEKFGEFSAMTAGEKDYVATRVAYKMDLRGPAISVHTACSTSLVATVQAVQSLRAGMCRMAIAGGASLVVPQKSGYLYQEGGMLSPDGHCRPFDANAQGTVFSDGVGAVVLKRLDDAVSDGDTIHAVIRGAALNNDGAEKASFTAPSVDGQAEVIALAQADAGVEPLTIRYVEAHGTATPLGDPIEVEALTQAFQAQGASQTGFCGIGSIKSNFGHLTAAAGVAGLIKTTLALKNREIPATLHFASPNPRIDFAGSPFAVVSQNSKWNALEGTPLRAGVSSFGVGGTNAHVIVEEAPRVDASGPSRPWQMLLLSGRTESALAEQCSLLSGALANGDVSLADAAYTLAVGRKRMSHRRFVVARSTAEAAAALADSTRVSGRQVSGRRPELAFLFPGQGSQALRMGMDLYRDEVVFREAFDACASALKPRLGSDLREVIFAARGDAAADEAALAALKDTFFTQPALFTVEYSLAQLWLSWGVEPDLLIGHSVGEFVAATLAGVFSLEDALHVVARRGELMRSMPPGAMLSVRQPAARVRERLALAGLLEAPLSIASINAPSLCVVAGPTDAVSRFQAELESEGVLCKPLHTSHAFHSAMMEPAVELFAETLRTIQLSAPNRRILSTVTAAPLTPEQATDPMYWARHMRATVDFSGAVTAALAENPARVMLEVGPRTTLATLTRQHGAQTVAISSLDDSGEENQDWRDLLRALGSLVAAGIEPDWTRFYLNENRRRTRLPTYPFRTEGKSYWPSTQPASAAPQALAATLLAAPQLRAEAPVSLPTPLAATPGHSRGRLEAILSRQVQIMQAQLALLTGSAPQPTTASAPVEPAASSSAPAQVQTAPNSDADAIREYAPTTRD